jgi:hypothetical protein
VTGTGPSGSARPDAAVCSARGCDRPATTGIRWNNRKIHPPERRKTWLACAEHEASLTEFLTARGMYRETVGVDELARLDQETSTS